MSKIRDVLLDSNPSKIRKDRFRWDVVVHEKIQVFGLGFGTKI
jgi:hypothetical protein